MQQLILPIGEDLDIKHRYQLIVKGFGIYTLNDDTIEAMYLGDNMECWERIRELDKAWVGLERI